MTQAFLIAIQFLTRVPVPATPLDAKTQGQSVLFYPLVGLLLGIGALLIAHSLAGLLPNSLAAICVLIFSVAITGALHLDGLADSADAWLGSHGDRQRCLDIMHDPTCGPAGVIALVLLLLAKFSAYEAIIAQANWYPILIAPVLARTAVVGLFLTTPYVRPAGIGENLKRSLPVNESYWVIAASVLVVLVFFSGFWSCVFAALLFYLLRRQMLHLLQGTTGDTAGAMIEIIELGVLIVALAVS